MTSANTLQRFRKFRRRRVKRFGKRALRGVNDFFGRNSLVGDCAVFEPGALSFTHELESRWRSIRDECERLLAGQGELPLVQTIHKDSKRVGRSKSWRIFLFYGFGYRSERNCAECPETSAALANVPGLQNAWFSILEPGCRIPPHCGVTKGLIRTHLPIILPREANGCHMTIEEREIHWRLGHCTVFDDMREHWAANDTEELRVVLLLDTIRPLRPMAAVLNRCLLAAVRRTAYVQDAYLRGLRWEDEFYASR